MSDPQHLRLVEALIFAAVKPLEESDLAKRLPEDVDVPTVLGDLAVMYAERGVNLVKRGDGWAFRTAPEPGCRFGQGVVVSRKLPRAAAETLAILAYQKGGEGVTRAEIEEIRGVSVSQGTLDMLFEAGWVRPLGRKEAPGRPMLWGTTEVFLDHFGLKSLEDLPGIEELKASGLLDAKPAVATYAARAGDESAPGEEPVEPLGDGEDEAGRVPAVVAVGAQEGAEEEALERAALADEMLDTPAAESEASDDDEDEDADDKDEESDDADDDSDEESEDDDDDSGDDEDESDDESADEDDDSDEESEDGPEDEDSDDDDEFDEDEDESEEDESDDDEDSKAESATAKEEN